MEEEDEDDNNEDQEDRIVNGYADHRKPWSADLYNEGIGSIVCGAAIINPRFVV